MTRVASAFLCQYHSDQQHTKSENRFLGHLGAQYLGLILAIVHVNHQYLEIALIQLVRLLEIDCQGLWGHLAGQNLGVLLP